MGQCYNSTIIDAPIDRVWRTIENFHDMGWGKPIIEKVDKVGAKHGTEPGAGRVLNGAFHETLVSVDPDQYTFTYSIDDGPGPVAKEAVKNYFGTVALHPVTDSDATFVVWTSSYESDSDAAVAEFCNPIYAGLLKALKSHLS